MIRPIRYTRTVVPRESNESGWVATTGEKGPWSKTASATIGA
jgi:hypothetical protein